MKILGKILPDGKKDKKTLYKILGVLVVGVMLLIASTTFLDTGKKVTSSNVSPTLTKPTKETSERDESIPYEVQMEERLKKILKKMQGVGEVEVMITTTYGKEMILAEDVTNHTATTREEDQEGGKREVQNLDTQRKVVMQNGNITAGNVPVVVKEKQPEVQGVLVIAEGAGNSQVKQSISEATQTLLGVAPHRVTVHQLQNSNK